MFKKFLNHKNLLSLFVALFLVACSSSVPIRNVPVYDKTASEVGGNSYSNSNVSAVDAVDPKSLPGMDLGPAGVARIVYFDLDSFVVKPVTIQSARNFWLAKISFYLVHQFCFAIHIRNMMVISKFLFFG